ncbi:MAG: tRNA-dihydrouridine synthase family protein [Kiritimatiellales bacterium]|nr:tRNA-dihydrouridine synthase family protein [Kiritimatiellales bacterium]
MSRQPPVLIFAPMRGVTTVHYRTAFAKHFQGLDIEMAPFISTVSAGRINAKLLKDVLPESNSGLPLIPQVMSNNADDFIQMNIALHELGYNEVNWNLGCPHKQIRRKQRGSGLLPHPQMVDGILGKVCAESPCRISVKVRLGVESSEELTAMIPVLNRYPLSEVVIHPRTAVQMYEGTVDLGAFETACSQLDHPVCYNGDIFDLAFFQTLEKRFPETGRFMLGRGLLSNPFLCEIIKSGNPQVENAIARIKAFHDDVVARYESVMHGDQPVLGKMKEFWTYQMAYLSNGQKLFKKVKKAHRVSTYKDIVGEFLADAEWKPTPTP